MRPLFGRAAYISFDRQGRLQPPPLVPHPFTIAFLAVLLISGLDLLLFGPVKGSVAASLPDWAVGVWALLLIISGATSTLGIYWKDQITGLLLEVAGCVALIPASILYVVVVASQDGFGAKYLFPVLLVSGYGLSAMFRIIQIRRFIEVMRIISTKVASPAGQSVG